MKTSHRQGFSSYSSINFSISELDYFLFPFLSFPLTFSVKIEMVSLLFGTFSSIFSVFFEAIFVDVSRELRQSACTEGPGNWRRKIFLSLHFRTNVLQAFASLKKLAMKFEPVQIVRKSSQVGDQTRHKSTQVKTCDGLRSRLIRP